MKPSIKTFPLILLLISLSCIILAVVLSINTFHSVHHKHFPIPRQTNVELIQGWMSVRYISKTYGVPEEIFSQKLRIDVAQNHKITLNAIAKKKNEYVGIVISDVQSLIQSFQATHQIPPNTN